jgi:hypothetical protein
MLRIQSPGPIQIESTDPKLFELLGDTMKKIMDSLKQGDSESASDYKLNLRITLDAIGCFPVAMDLSGDLSAIDGPVDIAVDRFVVTEIVVTPSGNTSPGTYSIDLV